MKLFNPIVPGFHPDPSICRVGQDYYLVNSTFEYFPGVPVHHSGDLVHWELIGHCLTRPSQLPLAGCRCSGGIYAPSIRYHDGRFYMITTNLTGGGNFVVTATDPAGEWSEPIWIDHPGIDPSLLFDDDGRVYYSGTGGPDLRGISQVELDLVTGKLLTPPRIIWTGTGGKFPEGPHLYKIDGRYYLMIAEGGTEYGHMETLARADNPWGPFEPCPRNPILTHRERMHQIQATGHADLFQAHDGSWWMVFLGIRHRGWAHHIGRETFLAPVVWDDAGWPVVGHNGTVDLEMDGPNWPAQPVAAHRVRDDFDSPTLSPVWNFLRNPYPADWSLTDRPGHLRLNGSAVSLSDPDSPAFVGRRQQHWHCRAAACLEFDPPGEGEEAGLVVLANVRYHYQLAVGRREGRRVVFVRRQMGDLRVVVACEPIEPGPVTLAIVADEEAYHFRLAAGDAPPRELASAWTRFVAKELCGGFTGVYIGMYATGNGRPCSAPADFDWFDYEPLPAPPPPARP